MIYQWKTGSRHVVAPEVAATVMNRLAQQNKLDAETLVEVSRSEDAPLHGEFEWDDQMAAGEYRKEQARHLIQHLVIMHDEMPETPPVRAFFKISTDTSVYEPIEAIITQPDKRTRLYNVALSELKSVRQKYSSIQEFAKVFAEIDELPA